MKQCPYCQTKYTDDTLKFCFQDGTPLINLANDETEIPTISFTDAETLVSPRRVERLDIPVESANPQNQRQDRQPQTAQFEPEAKKSKTFLIIALTALATLLLLGGAIGTWFYLKKDKAAIVQNTNKSAVNQNTPTTKDNLNTEVLPSPTAAPKTPFPTATPTATPAPNFNPEQVRQEVAEKVDAWQRATESGNVNAITNNYADTVDYYNKKSADLDTIRKDKQRAFNKYHTIAINISNLRVTPDVSGMRAVALFDKEWNFEGDESYSTGKVQTQLQLQKFNGRWLITGEKDLKVYYTE